MTNTEDHGFDEKATTGTSLPENGLGDVIHQRPASDKPAELTSEHQEQHTANNAANPSPKLPFSRARCIALVATVTGATFLNTFAVQSAVIILPTIAEDLGIPASRMQWIVSAYMLTFGCFLLLWGRIADLYGKRKVFILGTAWVTATTAANPFLPNEISVDLFRGLQGLGAAANVPTAIGILGTTFPPGKAKTYAFTVYLDWIGAFLITAGLLCLLFALTEGNVVGWSTPWVPVLIVVSLLLITLFILWQRHLETNTTRAPLMKPSIFRTNRRFGAALLTNGLFNASFNGYLIYATSFYQDYQNLSPLQTTLRFLPTGITGIATAAIASQLLLRIPASRLLLASTLCASASSLLFAAPIPPKTSYFAYGLWAMMLSTFGADTLGPCLALFTSLALPPAHQALGGGLLFSTMQLGRAIGLAVATAVQTAVMARERGVGVEDVREVQPWEEASLKGLRAGCWLNFGFGVAALALVVLAFGGWGSLARRRAWGSRTD